MIRLFSSSMIVLTCLLPTALRGDDALKRRAQKALAEKPSLRASFTRTTTDVFGTVKQKGEVVALNRPGDDKPDLARVSFLQKQYGKTWRERITHYWADDKFGYEYNVRAAVLKRYPRGDRLGLTNPKDALEAFLLFIKSPENLDVLYEGDEAAKPKPAVAGAKPLVYRPKPAAKLPKGAGGVEVKPKLDRIVIWIADDTGLPVVCRTELGKDSSDAFELENLDLETPVTEKDIAVDVPGHVKVVDEK